MSARDEAVEMIRRICPPHLDADEYGRYLAEKFAAHRAEALAEVEARLAAMTAEADQYTAELETEGATSASTMYAQYTGLRRARDEVRRMAGEEKATAEAATATPALTAEAIRHAADSVSHIHETCAKGHTTCLGCRVRADILDVLRSVADVIGGAK
jgi:hypothetical protein